MNTPPLMGEPDPDLRSVLGEAVNILRQHDPAGAGDALAAAQRDQTVPTVVVVGETKRGKSSLINAVLNAPGLSPVDPQVATSTYLVFDHGEMNAAYALTAQSPELVPIPLERLRDWATPLGTGLADDSAAEARAAGEQYQSSTVSGHNGPTNSSGYVPPRMLQIYSTSPLLRHLRLVDTPGVGGLDSAHGEVALSAIKQATALLFVSDASAPLSASELRFLARASGAIDVVLFAITKIDAFRGWRQIVEDNRALLREHAPRFADAAFFPVSSRLAEQAVAMPINELATRLRSESNIADLQIGLQTKVSARAAILRDANVLRAVHTRLSIVDKRLTSEQQALDPDPAYATELRRNRMRLIQARRQSGRTWQLQLRAEVSRARIDITHAIQREIREQGQIWRGIIDRADSTALARVPADLDAALHATSLRIFELLLGRFRQISDTVLRELFSQSELALIYARFAHSPVFTSPVIAPEKRPQSVEDKIVLFGGIASGLGASRLIAYVPALAGLGVSAALLAPISLGLGLGATAWMIRSRKRVADKNHYKIWISETLAEARAALESEVAGQFVDAEQSLTLALEQAIGNRVDELDQEIGQLDNALRMDGPQKQRRRTELAAQLAAIQQVLGKSETLLTNFRTKGLTAQ